VRHRRIAPAIQQPATNNQQWPLYKKPSKDNYNTEYSQARPTAQANTKSSGIVMRLSWPLDSFSHSVFLACYS